MPAVFAGTNCPRGHTVHSPMSPFPQPTLRSPQGQAVRGSVHGTQTVFAVLLHWLRANSELLQSEHKAQTVSRVPIHSCKM
eukprot:144936-Hanusia_phi.AAC.8